MIDTFNFPNDSLSRQVYYANSTGGVSWRIWNKPNNAKFVQFILLGGGGGAAGGVGGGSGTSRRGGAGGGSSSLTTGLFSASMLPDTLFVQVGFGGAGGAGGGIAGGAGGAGSLSYVGVLPDSGHTSINMLLVSGANAAGGGASDGTAGTAGTVWGGGILDFFGIANVYAGQAGAIGQTTAVPANITIAGITTGGAAGAGPNGTTPQNGGNITGAGFINTVLGGQSSGDTGSGGYMTSIPSSNLSSKQPMLFTGGAGGASSNLGPGGNGGAGTFGSGGGGGAGGFTLLGGAGGRGGDGIVIITCW